MERLTRKTMFGDYGLEAVEEKEIEKGRNVAINRLGLLEDVAENMGDDNAMKDLLLVLEVLRKRYVYSADMNKNSVATHLYRIDTSELLIDFTNRCFFVLDQYVAYGGYGDNEWEEEVDGAYEISGTFNFDDYGEKWTTNLNSFKVADDNVKRRFVGDYKCHYCPKRAECFGRIGTSGRLEQKGLEPEELKAKRLECFKEECSR